MTRAAKTSNGGQIREKTPWRVKVRFQLYVTGPQCGPVIAGSRLIKGDSESKLAPKIQFASDTPAEAEQNRKALELYLNSLAQ